MARTSSPSRLTGLTRYLGVLIVLLIPSYYFRFSVAGIPTNALEVAVLLFVALVVFRSWPLKVPYGAPLIALLMGLGAGVAVAIDKEVALGIVKGWFLIPMLFGWALVNWRDAKGKEWMMWALWANVIWVSVYALFQWWGAIPLVGYQKESADLVQYIDQGRALAFFESPNYLGMYLVPLTLFTGLYFWRVAWVRWTILLPFGAILATQSRSALLSLMLLVGAIVISAVIRRSRVAAWVIAAFVVVAVVMFLITKVNIGGLDGLRLGVWRVAISLINTHPILGIGPGQFPTYFQGTTILSSDLYGLLLPFALHPHSLYFGMWLSTGIIGLFGFVWLVLSAIRNCLAGMKEHAPLVLATLGGLGAICVQGIFDSSYFKNDLSLIFWFFMATAWWATQRKSEAPLSPS